VKALTGAERQMTGIRRGIAGLAAVVAGIGLAWPVAWPAGAVGLPGWRVVLRAHFRSAQAPHDSVFDAVVTPARNDVWVFGSTDVAGNGGKPVAEHWNGHSWSRVSLPAALKGSVFAASAASRSDIWAVSEDSGWVLHWNGARWSVALRLKENGYHADFTGVTAVNQNDVWVFGGEDNGLTDLVGFGTWHFNGRTWKHLSPRAPGGNVVQASAESASDLWGVGINFSNSPTEGKISHYNGRTWKNVKMTGSGMQWPRDEYAATASRVWVDGYRSSTPRLIPVLARWNGRSWQKVAVHGPKSADLLDGITPDGHGGLWIEAEDSASGRWWMLHRTASGTWASTALASFASIGQAALVPGTSSLWGAGATPVSGGDDAEIWAYGPLGG
jgi:hypothetical protein